MRVYTARWLLPVSAPPVRDGAVAVDPAGRIAYAGPAAGAPPGEVVPLGDAALLPGLVAALPNAPWVGGPLPLRPFLDHAAPGVTTLSLAVRSDAELDASLDALLASGLRTVVYVAVRGPLPSDRAPALDALERAVAAVRARAAGTSGRVRAGVALSTVAQVDEDLLIDASAWAVGQRLPLAIPASASPAELAYVRDASGPYADALRSAGVDVVRRAHSTVHLLAELGVAAVARPLLVGGALFDESDIALAAYYGCPVAYAPTLDARPTLPDPLAALVDAGVDVTLAAADPLARARAERVAPDAALHIATLGAARALGFDADVGSLEAGKHADLVAYSLTPAQLQLADEHGPARALLDAARRPPMLTLIAGVTPPAA